MQEKEKILELSYKNNTITLIEIADILNISPEKVRNHVLEIKKMDYKIEITGESLHLWDKENLLLPVSLTKDLNTEVFGKREIHYYLETDSTHPRAEELATSGVPEGTIVIAERQTAGRGRNGRSWYSKSKDSIYLSMILRPEYAPAKVQGVTLMTAVSVYEALSDIYDLPFFIKWPNDILINGKKTAGILTTMNSSEKKVNHVVVGIGINVNTDISLMPGEIRYLATSLFHESGKREHRTKVLKTFLESFEKNYMLFTNGKFQDIVNAWVQYSGLPGKLIEITITNKIIEGKVIGIDNNGYLLIESKNGILHKVISGEITKIRNSQ